MSSQDGMRALPMSGILQVSSSQAALATRQAQDESPHKVVRLQGQFSVEGTEGIGKGDIDLDEYFFDGDAVYNRLKKPWRRKEVIKVLDKRIQFYKDRHGNILDDRIEAKFAHQARELKLLSKVQEEDEQRQKMTAAEQETAAIIEHGHREFIDFAIDEVERPATKQQEQRDGFEWSAAGAAHKVIPVLAGSRKVHRINLEDDDAEFLGFSGAVYDHRLKLRAPPPPAEAFQVDFVRDFLDESQQALGRRNSSMSNTGADALSGHSRKSMAAEMAAQAHRAAQLLRTTSPSRASVDGGFHRQQSSEEEFPPWTPEGQPSTAMTGTSQEMARNSRGFTMGTAGTQGSNWHVARRFGVI
mmetsp:Transcript_69655/g.167174  ORF Transcript_69655/g.167174 Transcript_69655/m.167174 type:complete len:357 (+) Transcript_69655:116-1186(+)